MFPFLSTQLISGASNDKIVVSTENEIVVSNHGVHLNDIISCNIEEKDERFLLHTLDASKCFGRALIKTVDSDIAIIATAAFQKIHSIKEIWIEFGKGKSIKFIPVHEIVSDLV